MLAGKTVLLCVSGSIAAYKIAYLASALKKLKLHKPLDKCGFSSAHRSHNTHIDLSARPRLDILVYMEMIHKNTPSHILLQCMREGDILYRQSLFLRRSTEKYRLLQGLF